MDVEKKSKIPNIIYSVIVALALKYIFGLPYFNFVFFAIMILIILFFLKNDDTYLIQSFFITYCTIYLVAFTLITLVMNPSDLNKALSIICKGNKFIFFLNCIIFFSFSSALNKVLSIEKELDTARDTLRDRFYFYIKKFFGVKNVIKTYVLIVLGFYALVSEFTTEYLYYRGSLILLIIFVIILVIKSLQGSSNFWRSSFEETTGFTLRQMGDNNPPGDIDDNSDYDE